MELTLEPRSLKIISTSKILPNCCRDKNKNIWLWSAFYPHTLLSSEKATDLPILHPPKYLFNIHGRSQPIPVSEFSSHWVEHFSFSTRFSIHSLLHFYPLCMVKALFRIYSESFPITCLFTRARTKDLPQYISNF